MDVEEIKELAKSVFPDSKINEYKREGFVAGYRMRELYENEISNKRQRQLFFSPDELRAVYISYKIISAVSEIKSPLIDANLEEGFKRLINVLIGLEAIYGDAARQVVSSDPK